MPQSMEVVINFRFINLSLEILCTCNKQFDYFGCDYEMCYFMCAKGPTFWSFIVERLKSLDMERSHAICVVSSSSCGWLD